MRLARARSHREVAPLRRVRGTESSLYKKVNVVTSLHSCARGNVVTNDLRRRATIAG